MSTDMRVYAKVDLDIIEENVHKLHSLTKSDTGIYAVVKADAYGHGANEVSKRLEKLDFVKGFCIATLDEGIALREAGITKPILMLGYAFPGKYDEMIRNDITPPLFREDNIDTLNEAAKALGKTVNVHIKVDTGMGRIGITPDDEGIKFVKKVLDATNIKLEGIFTHFARADENEKDNADKQFGVFTGFIDRIKNELSYDIPIKHCSNSAAILTMPYANMDMVRPGIVIYGLSPSGEVTAPAYGLKPALSLYSTITYIKRVKAGTPISYGGTFVTDKETLIATIPVGYGDGYPRSLSNKGCCIIRGKKAPIIGRVCMDQMMVDVTDVPGVCVDDEVILIGCAGNECISADWLGDIADRFNYELVCDLGKRVSRIY